MNQESKQESHWFHKLLATGSSTAFLPLRLVAGLTLAAHGAQKLLGWFGGGGLSGTAGFFSEQLGLVPGHFWAFNAGAGEFLGGLMIAFGFLTRIGAGLNAIAMAVAVLLVHRSAFFLDSGGMEYALLLFVVSVGYLIAGGGGASVDRVLLRNKENQPVTEPAAQAEQTAA